MNHDPCHYLQEEINEKDAEIERLKELLARAADALDWPGQHPDYVENLITELRKAAQ